MLSRTFKLELEGTTGFSVKSGCVVNVYEEFKVCKIYRTHTGAGTYL
jgi:hypothetical protein